MRPKPNFLAAYPAALTQQVQKLIEEGTLAERFLNKYPAAHAVRNDKSLYDFVMSIKEPRGSLSSVVYDSTLHIDHNALGLHTRSSQVQGGNLKSRREIRIAAVFKDMPVEFLRMIVVHELAHLKELEHNKAFYRLCLHMEPDYHQLEFDVRAYLTWLAQTDKPLW